MLRSAPDYPTTTLTSFREISIQIGTKEPPEIQWEVFEDVTNCGQHAEVVSQENPGGEVDLFYKNVPAGQFLFEYKGDEGTTVIDHIEDKLPGTTSLPGSILSSGTTEMWRSKWTKGWTSIEPFQLKDSSCLFEYKVADGMVVIDQLNPQAAGVTPLWRGKWSTGWTTIKPFTLGDKVFLVSYKIGDGKVAISQIHPDFQGTTQVWHDSWTKGWQVLSSRLP